VSKNREPFLSELAPEVLKVGNEPLERNGAVGSRRPEGSTLIVENKMIMAGERFDCGPQIALLCAPPSVKYNNGVAGSSCSAELHDVKIDFITRFQVPVFSSVRKMLPVRR
jgi:hypothetical protein